MVRDLGSEKRAVGEERNQKALPLGVGVDVEEISAGEDLAAGKEEPETAGAGEFVEDAAVLLAGQLGAGGVPVGERQVVVTLSAPELAAAGDFDGRGERDALRDAALVQAPAEFGVALAVRELCFR